jgi:hypothetical protein
MLALPKSAPMQHPQIKQLQLISVFLGAGSLCYCLSSVHQAVWKNFYPQCHKASSGISWWRVDYAFVEKEEHTKKEKT